MKKTKLSSIRVGLIKAKGTENKILKDLKYRFNYIEIKTILNEILSGKLRGKRVFTKSLLPNEYKDVSSGYLLYELHGNDSLIKELNWNFAFFEYFQKQINEFLSLQEKFESELIIGNYNISEKVLEQIETNICKSIWSMEKRFIQEEYKNGLGGNKNFLKTIHDNNQEPIIYFLADFMSFKVEENTTFQQYFNQLKKLTENISNEMLISYLNYKLNYQYPISKADVTFILTYEGKSSIIDRYLTTIRMCKYMVSNPEFKSYHSLIYNALTDLSKLINDPNLNNVLLYLNPKTRINNINQPLLALSDLYTEGYYLEALENAKVLIEEQSNVFEIYEFYLKSLMYVKSEFIPINDKDNLQNRILRAMYHSYVRNENFHDSFKELLKIAILLGDFNLSMKINAFLTRKHLSEFKEQINMYSELSSKYITPRFTLIYSSKDSGIEFLNNIQKETEYNITTSFFELSIKNINMQCYSNIPRPRRNIQLAKMLMENKLYNVAVALLEEITEDLSSEKHKPIYNYLNEKVNVLLFNLYLKIEQTLKSMAIYIENYLIDSNLVLRMDLKQIVSSIEDKDSKILKKSIYTPLLSYLNYKNDTTKIHSSYANFMDLNGYNKPSLIPMTDFDEKGQQLLIFFLSKVCSPDVLESSVLTFQTEEDVRKERINICQKLLEVDNQNEYEYIKEITENTQKIKVSNKLREIDESRIDINVKGIKNDPESVYKENFVRYLNSQKTSFDFMILDINDINNISDITNFQELRKNIKVQDPGFLLFKEALCDLRDQFTFNSKYGLDSSLSTRIRHGALLNELRRPFEIFNLILSKKNKHIDIYDLSNHWLSKLNQINGLHLKKPLKDILGAFSKKIDQKIDLINNDYMRIKTESKNPHGLFEFVLHDYDILQIFRYFNKNSTDDIEKFFDTVMQMMWSSTEESLKIIRENLNNSIKNDFLIYLDQLQEEISNLNKVEDERILTEISADIINCRTELQIQIEKISNWFRVSTTTEYSDFDALVLVDTCIETLGNLDKYKNIEINKEVNTNLIFKGYTFTYLIDILNIFINNAMQHSKFDDLTDLVITISINEENEYINLKVENNFSENVDKGLLQTKIKEINDKVNDLEYIKKYHAIEGGSGYIKIFKILYYNLITHFKIHLDIKHPNTFHVNISIKKNGLANNTVEE